MATISLNTDAAPTEVGEVTFSFGGTSFRLAPGNSIEITDQDVVKDAQQHPWLTVALPPVDPTNVPQVDLSDPHQNPSADHLSSAASPAAIAAAEAANAAILAKSHPDGLPGGLPAVAPAPVETVAPAPAPAPVPEPAPAPAPTPEVTP